MLDGVLLLSKAKEHNDGQIFIKVSREDEDIVNSLDKLKRIFEPLQNALFTKRMIRQ